MSLRERLRGVTERKTERKTERDNGARIRCSFCAKSTKQVDFMFAGPGVNICDECVGRAWSMVMTRMAERNGEPIMPPPKKSVPFPGDLTLPNADN